jgi:uncharacterized membrane protein YebE (DUF533 family)
MDESRLIRGVIGSVLGRRGRRSGRALRYLTGRRGALWSNPTVLLTVAGVAWGIVDALQTRASAVAPQPSFVPPLPGAASVPPLISSDALRMVRLAIAAARADGVVDTAERAAILEHARAAGAESVVAAELERPRPLAEIVAGVADEAERATLYGLAFGLLRGDEQPNGAERIFLATLAHLLGLDPGGAQAIEERLGQGIDRTDPEA